MFKGKAIEIKGHEARELIEMLNKAFGCDEVEKEPTEVHVPSEEPTSDHMEAALTSKAIYDAHIAVGFSEEQAFEILKAIIMA